MSDSAIKNSHVRNGLPSPEAVPQTVEQAQEQLDNAVMTLRWAQGTPAQENALAEYMFARDALIEAVRISVLQPKEQKEQKEQEPLRAPTSLSPAVAPLTNAAETEVDRG